MKKFFKDKRKFEDHYETVREVGGGAFAIVYEGEWKMRVLAK